MPARNLNNPAGRMFKFVPTGCLNLASSDLSSAEFGFQNRKVRTLSPSFTVLALYLPYLATVILTINGFADDGCYAVEERLE